jgi:23S rRNA pseudouridine1911/1915/1917 synthase
VDEGDLAGMQTNSPILIAPPGAVFPVPLDHAANSRQLSPDPESGTLEHYITRNTRQNKSYVHNKEVPDSKWARLSYRKLASSDHYHLLEVLLETGRHHQIRAQLAGIGSVIKGDRKYGARRSNKNGGISLHAREISFVHPVKKETLKVVAPYPKMDIFPVFKW